jgi:hypothetical protein
LFVERKKEGIKLKYPKYVFKRINGQQYVHGVSDSVIENLMYEKERVLKTQNSKRKVV